jgi:hypothetical protein
VFYQVAVCSLFEQEGATQVLGLVGDADVGSGRLVEPVAKTNVVVIQDKFFGKAV